MREIRDLQARARAFEKEAHHILAAFESSSSRSIELEETYRKLGGLSLAQDELFRQALRCLEERLYRAAHVMAWAGFIDFLSESMVNDHLTQLHQVRPTWKFSDVEDLRENFAEYQLLDAARDLKIFTKTETKALHGLLSKRNECAHPSRYFPNLNESIGYVAEVLHRLERLA